MPALTAAVVLIGALCLLHLLLTFGVVRRLRDHTATLERLTSRGGSLAAGNGSGRDAARAIEAFTATTIDGEAVSPDLLVGHNVVVFIAPECDVCRDQIPELVRWAGRQERKRVLAVIDGTVSDTTDLVEVLNPVARVIVEPAGTPVSNAFGVSGYPSSYLVNDGMMVAWAYEVTKLPAPV